MPFIGALLLEPCVVALGLCASALAPGLLAVALLDGGRKVAHYALLKPTKEGLYAALDSDAQFIAKPLLDTLVYRSFFAFVIQTVFIISFAILTLTLILSAQY